MSRWSTLLVIAMLALALATTPAYAQAQGGMHALTVAADEVIHGDLASVEQPILIAGRVEGDVTSWSGSIQVLGEVDGDVVSYTGGIEIGPGARVMGSVLSLGGGVSRTGEALVAGQVLGEQPITGGALMADVAKILRPQPDLARADLPLPLISTVLTLIGLLLTLMCAALWPNRTLGISRALRSAPGSSLAIGLLTTMLLALLLLPLSGMLALSLVGLPLLLPLTLMLQAPYLFGLAGLGRALGERIRPGVVFGGAVAGVALLLVSLGVTTCCGRTTVGRAAGGGGGGGGGGGAAGSTKKARTTDVGSGASW